MNKGGLVSIITPTYNRAGLISRMINSVRSQDYENWELIIMDDGSTDNTKEIIDSFLDNRIKYYYTKNSGAGDKRNQGVENSSGEDIIFLDSDDEVKPNWLSSLLFSKEQKKGNIVCCGLEKYDHNGKLISVQMPRKLEGIFNNIEANYLAGTLLLNKELFNVVGGYDINLESGQHTDLMLRLVPEIINRKLKVISIDQSLLKVHNHQGAKIRNNSNSIYKGTLKILQKHNELFKRDKETHYNYLNIAGIAAFGVSKPLVGNKLFINSLILYPIKVKTLVRIMKYNIQYLISKISFNVF